MAKFNRSEIFKAAWARYRSIRACYAAWQVKRGIVDGSFSNALKNAWAAAKSQLAKAEKQKAIDASPEARSIIHQIQMLEFKSSRIDIQAMRTALETKLDTLIAA